jgi:hypothetical protein
MVVAMLNLRSASDRFSMRLGDQLLVRHDGLAAVARADQGVAGLDVGDHALEGVHLHGVADAQAALEQDHEAAHVVGRQLLQAEAQADAERAAQHRQRREVHAHGRQREQEADQQQAARIALTATLRSDRSVTASRSMRFQAAGDPQRQHQHQAGRQHALEDAQQADARLAEGEA